MTGAIIQPGQLETPAGEIPFLRLPARDTFFKDRAERFRQLARERNMNAFLAYMARIADAQHAALQRFPQVPLPEIVAAARRDDHLSHMAAIPCPFVQYPLPTDIEWV